jgi:hypothetical protein
MKEQPTSSQISFELGFLAEDTEKLLNHPQYLYNERRRESEKPKPELSPLQLSLCFRIKDAHPGSYFRMLVGKIEGFSYPRVTKRTIGNFTL